MPFRFIRPAIPPDPAGRPTRPPGQYRPGRPRAHTRSARSSATALLWALLICGMLALTVGMSAAPGPLAQCAALAVALLWVTAVAVALTRVRARPTRRATTPSAAPPTIPAQRKG